VQKLNSLTDLQNTGARWNLCQCQWFAIPAVHCWVGEAADTAWQMPPVILVLSVCMLGTLLWTAQSHKLYVPANKMNLQTPEVVTLHVLCCVAASCLLISVASQVCQTSARRRSWYACLMSYLPGISCVTIRTVQGTAWNWCIPLLITVVLWLLSLHSELQHAHKVFRVYLLPVTLWAISVCMVIGGTQQVLCLSLLSLCSVLACELEKYSYYTGSVS
jgi:hypothetical protein